MPACNLSLWKCLSPASSFSIPPLLFCFSPGPPWLHSVSWNLIRVCWQHSDHLFSLWVMISIFVWGRHESLPFLLQLSQKPGARPGQYSQEPLRKKVPLVGIWLLRAALWFQLWDCCQELWAAEMSLQEVMSLYRSHEAYSTLSILSHFLVCPTAFLSYVARGCTQRCLWEGGGKPVLHPILQRFF